MKTLVQQYAEFVTELKYEDLPGEAVRAARQCILDGMANMIYGTTSETGRKALCYAKKMKVSGKTKARIPGGQVIPQEAALFASAVMARCADLDDGHRVAMGHPGSVLVPALMICGQERKLSGEALITALTAGYEIYIRLGSAINPSSYREKGFDSTGITGTVACTAALAKVYGLNAEQTANALGIAAQFAGGLIEYQNDGSMAKVLMGVWAIDTALRSVDLARAGFTGAREALEGPKGFIQAFSSQPHPEKAAEDLGKVFRIPETYFKMYACMRGLHAAVDALLSVREKRSLRGEDIASIEVRTTPFVGRLSKPHPETEIGAQSSIEFALAAAAYYGHISGEAVLKEAMGRPEIYDLASRITVVMDRKIEEYVKENPSHWGAVRLVVRGTDGTKAEAFAGLPGGEAENPFTVEQMNEKCCRLAAGTAYEAVCAKLCGEIAGIENMADPFRILDPENI